MFQKQTSISVFFWTKNSEICYYYYYTQRFNWKSIFSHYVSWLWRNYIVRRKTSDRGKFKLAILLGFRKIVTTNIAVNFWGNNQNKNTAHLKLYRKNSKYSIQIFCFVSCFRWIRCYWWQNYSFPLKSLRVHLVQCMLVSIKLHDWMTQVNKHMASYNRSSVTRETLYSMTTKFWYDIYLSFWSTFLWSFERCDIM